MLELARQHEAAWHGDHADALVGDMGRVVAIGGGTGLSVVLRGLSESAVRSRVLPATTEDVRILAEFGESRITSNRRRVRRVSLVPGRVRAAPGVVAAITAADTIVVGPGSFYTSVLPTLLVREIAAAIARTRARVVFVLNLMTEPGETDGYSACDSVLALRRHARQLPLGITLLVNDAPIPPQLAERYAASGAFPIAVDRAALRSLGCEVVARDLLALDASLLRHDPFRLAAALSTTPQEVAA